MIARVLGPVESRRTFAACLLLAAAGLLSPALTGSEVSALLAAAGVMPACRG